MNNTIRIGAAITSTICASTLAQTQLFELSYDAPSLDRWNYPFNGSPGSRLSASTFGAVELDGFDDHDAQLVLGFATSSDVPTGLDGLEYQVLSARVTITNTNGDVFRYEPDLRHARHLPLPRRHAGLRSRTTGASLGDGVPQRVRGDELG